MCDAQLELRSKINSSPLGIPGPKSGCLQNPYYFNGMDNASMISYEEKKFNERSKQ